MGLSYTEGGRPAGNAAPGDGRTVRRVRDTAVPEFRQATAIYSPSFPANETRPVGETRRMLGSERYALWVAGPAGGAHAFAPTYERDGFALLDYIAVERSRRGSGLGSAPFAGLPERLDTGVLLLEVQNSDGIHAERDARMRFWRYMGAVAITAGYVLPSYTGEPETVSRGRGMPSASGARRYGEPIHRDACKYAKTDLADATMRSMGVQP